MHWEQLFSPKRLGEEHKTVTELDLIRNPYQRDYDRLIFASPFRRLQNKTQVFPLPGSIFVHNRLTHSLEVASVGRSLGMIVGQRIVEEEKSDDKNFQRFYAYELGSVISAACLAHDIGNPPFGHSGEKAISNYFKTIFEKEYQDIRRGLTDTQWQDLTSFEGNANGLRVLTHPFNETSPGGYRLTYTTLASMVKYPCESTAGLQKKVLSRKKYGFFDSEKETFRKIAAELGLISHSDEQLIYARHPFVFLVEAADDICYQIIDWEDAHRLGILNWQETCDGLMAFFEPTDEKGGRESIRQTVAKISDENKKIEFLRAMVIGRLVEQCNQVFWQHRDEILMGCYEKSLTDDLPATTATAMDQLKQVSVQRIYNHRSVAEVELAGYKILGGLLEEFVPAALRPTSPYAEKLLQLLPRQFQYTGTDANPYARIQSVVDFVSGMTDLFAVELYRKIKGISMPELR